MGPKNHIIRGLPVSARIIYIDGQKKWVKIFEIRNSEFLNHSEDEKETFNFYSTFIAEYILTFKDIKKNDFISENLFNNA